MLPYYFIYRKGLFLVTATNYISRMTKFRIITSLISPTNTAGVFYQWQTEKIRFPNL